MVSVCPLCVIKVVWEEYWCVPNGALSGQYFFSSWANSEIRLLVSTIKNGIDNPKTKHVCMCGSLADLIVLCPLCKELAK